MAVLQGDSIVYIAAKHKDAKVAGVVLRTPNTDTPNTRVLVRCQECGGIERPYLREVVDA